MGVYSMVSISEHATLEAASKELLDFVLEPEAWVLIEEMDEDETLIRPSYSASYQRRVGSLRICASVDVTPGLDVQLRIAFRGPGLTPTTAANHLEAFLQPRVPLVPNTEWEVEVDDRKWIHFSRPYLGESLYA